MAPPFYYATKFQRIWEIRLMKNINSLEDFPIIDFLAGKGHFDSSLNGLLGHPNAP